MTTLAPIFAPWPAPKTVKALVTTRFGGASLGAFTGLNLSFNVGDDAACVQENHVRLQHHCQLPAITFVAQASSWHRHY